MTEAQQIINFKRFILGVNNSNDYEDWQIERNFANLLSDSNFPTTYSSLSITAIYGSANPHGYSTQQYINNYFGRYETFDFSKEAYGNSYYYNGKGNSPSNFYRTHNISIGYERQMDAFIFSRTGGSIKPLEDKIDAEIKNRASADSTLSQNIINVNTILNNRIDSVNQDLNNRIDSVNQDLNNEITRSKKADSDLDDKKLNRSGKETIKIDNTDKTNVKDWQDDIFQNGVLDSTKTINTGTIIGTQTFWDAIKNLDDKKLNRYGKETVTEKDKNGNDVTVDKDWDTTSIKDSTKAITSSGVIDYIRTTMQWSKDIVNVSSEKYGCISIPFSADKKDVMLVTLVLANELIELSVTAQGVSGSRNTTAASSNVWYYYSSDKCFIFFKTTYTTNVFVKTEGISEPDDNALAVRGSDITVTETEILPANTIAVSLKN